jgi:hypothetical protein
MVILILLPFVSCDFGECFDVPMEQSPDEGIRYTPVRDARRGCTPAMDAYKMHVCGRYTPCYAAVRHEGQREQAAIT